MNACPHCSAPLTAPSRFCPACGKECGEDPQLTMDLHSTIDLHSTTDLHSTIDLRSTTDLNATIDLNATADYSQTTPSAATPTSYASKPSTSATNRFIPGAMVTERYRIVGLLGRGGMGEVYRADDLKLGQPVALKFLPVGLEQDQALLTRFMNEVRTALKVTHANVCRVYDIGEFDGQHFLSMEYVDGEDLSSLLRRVGRLPQDRAVEVARQICAGLAAAHDQGILHRDLKPANVMIDGRGQARLTDFGLAGWADQIDASEISSGTPAYMAPEQIAGHEVTKRSDIYALGLVLYELFTGRQTFKADTVADVKQMHTTAAPSNLTNFVSDLDPTIERTVLQCLAKNPSERPASALAVSAGLPGGDPLAAALAAGETPSPELVAEAGAKRGMPKQRALTLAALAIALLIGGARWAGTMSVTNYLAFDRQPEVMEERARSIIQELGYTEDSYQNPADNAWGYVVWNAVIKEVRDADSTGTGLEALRDRPDAISYWYRQSPVTMQPTSRSGPIMLRGPVAMTNPSLITAGEIVVLLDGAGNLRRIDAMPTRFSLADTVKAIDWRPIFAMADLDIDRFTPDRPRYQRYQTPDNRAGWLGTHVDRPEVELRVDAGSYEGRVVLFNVATMASLGSLSVPPSVRPYTITNFLAGTLQPFFILVIVVFAAALSRRNGQQGRADQRGAMRVGVLTFGLFIVANSLYSHTMYTRLWSDELWSIIVGASFVGLTTWVLYRAAEPTGRQVWPSMFMSSSRLLSRPKVNWLDPLIGQSVLIGLVFGSLTYLIRAPIFYTLKHQITGKTPPLLQVDTTLLTGQRQALGQVLDQSLLLTFYFILVMALILIRKKVKNLPLALGLTVAFWALANGQVSLESYLLNVLVSVIMMFVLLRWGVVAFVIAEMTLALSFKTPSADWSAWHAQSPIIVLGALICLTCYGAWAAIGRRVDQD